MNGNQNPQTGSELYLRYNREERLKRASESVRQMYEPDYIKHISILKSLTAMRSNRSSFFALLIVFALAFGSLFLTTDRKSGKICGIPVKLAYLSQDRMLYVNVVFSASAQYTDEPLPVSIYLRATNKNTDIQDSKTIDAVYIGSSLSIPAQFQANTFQRLEIIVRANNKTLTLKTSLKE